MKVSFNGWEFDVDMNATMAHSAQEKSEHCTCSYCRNYYEVLDTSYPNLRSFLAELGLDAEAPDELMPFTATLVACYYAVSGKILRQGPELTYFDEIPIVFQTAEEAMINTNCPNPWFALLIGPIKLPWVLDEPLIEDEIVSPANTTRFLKKMRDFVLRFFDHGPVS